jgi:ribonuclease P protein component
MFSYPKKQRLIDSDSTAHVFKKGKRIQMLGVSCYHMANQSGFARLGVIAAKKQIPSAVDRNRLRRIARESFRLAPLPAVDIVLFMHRSVLRLSKTELRETLDQLWEKLIA